MWLRIFFLPVVRTSSVIPFYFYKFSMKTKDFSNGKDFTITISITHLSLLEVKLEYLRHLEFWRP